MNPTYAQLMAKAEQVTNRKEAKKLINQATETMNTLKNTEYRLTLKQVNEYIDFQQTKLTNAQAHVRLAEKQIEMLNDLKERMSE